jgi:hypothetical protein
MIAIQVILIIAFAVFLLRLVTNPNSYQIKAWAKILGVLLVLAAVGAVLFPDSSNTVAHWVGVSRGADLLLYMLTLAFIFVVLNIYISEKQNQRRIVSLARKIAILEAEALQKLNDKQ